MGKPFLAAISSYFEERYAISHNITPLVIGLWTPRFSERIARGLRLYPDGYAPVNIVSQRGRKVKAFLRALSKKFCAKLRI